MRDANRFRSDIEDACQESSAFVQTLVDVSSADDETEWLALLIEEVGVNARDRARCFAQSLYGRALPAEL